MDIVEQLRKISVPYDVVLEAADEIERLRKKVELRENEIEWLRKKLINFYEMSNRPIIYAFTEKSAKALREKE